LDLLGILLVFLLGNGFDEDLLLDLLGILGLGLLPDHLKHYVLHFFLDILFYINLELWLYSLGID
jgi:hypothetical protein